MRLFLYEDITGGGCAETPTGSLLSEGRAMRDALIEDFAQLDDADIVILHDERLPGPTEHLSGSVEVVLVDAQSHRQRFREMAADADWSLVIAPEFDDRLLERCGDVEAAGGKLLGPDSSLVALCSDKFVLLDHLSGYGLPLPNFARGDAPPPADFPFPAVLKPRFGAGSIGVERVESREQFSAPQGEFCLESFVDGQPVSVFVLKGPSRHFVLPGCRQRLGGDTGFQFLGGELPVPAAWQTGLESLAQSVLRALPEFVGHMGIDAVYDAESGNVVLIEVNPRLTTSYVGLRRLIDSNLAACMLEVAQGGDAVWRTGDEPVRFLADGCVQTADSS